MEQEKFDLKKVKIYRTREGNAFEIAVAILLITAWTLALFFDKIAAFDFLGIYLPSVIFTPLAIVLMVVAYHPRYIHYNIPGINGFSNIRQVALAVRSVRVIGLAVAMMILMQNVLIILGKNTEVVSIVFVVVMIFTALLFSFLIYRAK